MNALVIFLGESFRSGGQGTRQRGHKDSFDEQINASKSHINFLNHINDKYKFNKLDVHIATYTTLFQNDLLSIYEPYLNSKLLLDTPIGLSKLFIDSLKIISNLYQYAFILYIRIDLLLRPQFEKIYDEYILYIRCIFIHKYIPLHTVRYGVQPSSPGKNILPKKTGSSFPYVCPLKATQK